MREWFEAQLAAGLPALSGSHLSGTLAVKQEMVNELIAQWLASESAPGGTGASPALDLGKARAAIKSAAVRGEPGRILVDFDIQI